MPIPYFPAVLLAHDQVALGDLVLSRTTPWNDFRSYPRALQESCDYSRQTEQLDKVRSNASCEETEGHAGKLFEAAKTSGQGSLQRLRTMASEVLRLKNSGDKFELDMLGSAKRQRQRSEATVHVNPVPASDDVREWLEKQMIGRGLQVYMIVGLHTLKDVAIAEIQSMASSSRAEVHVPGPVNTSLRTQRERRTAEGRSILAPGNQIFAVEYRQVFLKSRIFRKAKVKDAYLAQDNVWKPVGELDEQRVETGFYSQFEEADVEDEYLEAILVDDMAPLEVDVEFVD
ncbi:MAG: hypothetical protein Q9227_002336 [Pyrenula ochraceoflavens]